MMKMFSKGGGMAKMNAQHGRQTARHGRLIKTI